MSDEVKKTLGRQLEETYEKLEPLMDKANDEEFKALRKQRKALDDIIRQRVDAKMNEASEEYKAVTEKLQEASASIQKALDGIDTVVAAITAVAEVLDLVEKSMA